MASVPRELTSEGQRAEKLGRYATIVFVVEGLARARAVNGEGITGSGKAVVDDLGLRRVGEQSGIRIDASGSVEHNRPARHKLHFAADAQARLLQVVWRDDESMLISVTVHQGFAFVVIAIFR
jgi:diphthamide synthase (EF-2-diphthine--ammonia ligase)